MAERTNSAGSAGSQSAARSAPHEPVAQGTLIHRLARGWAEDDANAVEDAARVLSRQLSLSSVPAVSQLGSDFAVLMFSLDQIRLRNFGNVAAVLLSGETAVRLDLLRVSLNPADRQIIVFALSDHAFLDAEAAFPARQGFLVLEPSESGEILTGSAPAEVLKQLARRRLSTYRLNPFGILTVPGHNMFTGRLHELEQLSQGAASLAIAGPGRIGKSSLIQQHLRRLQREDPLRAARTVLVDYMNCDAKSDAQICQHLTVPINPNKKAHEATPEKLEKFLRAEGSARGGPLELLLDEVDAVCSSKTFNILAEAAKNDVCRLILCGKQNLYEAMNDGSHVFSGRLSLLRLHPLSLSETKSLLLQPLRDLGFAMPPLDEDRICTEVFDDTAGFPHLVQYYGAQLVNIALKEASGVVNFEHFDAVRNSYETLQLFAGPILDMKDPREEYIALNIVHGHQESFSESDIQNWSKTWGVPLSETGSSRLCRQLYINNVLSWHSSGRYHLANPALRRSAQKLGFLQPRLQELAKQFRGGRRAN